MNARTIATASTCHASRFHVLKHRSSKSCPLLQPCLLQQPIGFCHPTSASHGLNQSVILHKRRAGIAAAYDASSNGSNGSPSSSFGSSSSSSSSVGSGKPDYIGELVAPFKKFASLWRKFLPMVLLFFMLSFVNTVVDSLKDTLVITAVGGGAEVIPYLTVYAVLPVSVLFLVAYSYATLFLSRAAVFNAVVTAFMGFFAFFAFVLYPNHNSLHLHELADTLTQVLPAGLSGIVGMIRNWTFTLFFCFSEMWGDVGLGLLFWTLANDITSVTDAPVLYPMFGLGANAAQALAGGLLSKFSSISAAMHVPFDHQLQVIMIVVLGCSGLVMAMHHYITVKQDEKAKMSKRTRNIAPPKQDTASHTSTTNGVPSPSNGANLETTHALDSSSINAAANGNGRHLDGNDAPEQADSQAALRPQVGVSPAATTSSAAASLARMFMHARGPSHGAGPQSATTTSYSSTYDFTPGNGSVNGQSAGPSSSTGTASHTYQHASNSSGTKKEKEKLTLKEAYQVLAQSIEIRSLAVMSIAQGLCASLMEFAWKCHIKILHPSPSDFTAYLGEVACWTGIVTGTLMLASPILFDRLKWRGVAESTPKLLLFGGSVFFVTCIAFQQFFASSLGMSGAQGALALVMLNGLVAVGALLYICSRGAKYSLYKPAEEMVYICMDDNARTKGKAAIDVVGSQLGKSSASVLQQVLLLISAGTLVGILPVMFVVFFGMLRAWMKSVFTLSQHFNFEEEHRRSMMSMSQEEEDNEEGGGSTVWNEDKGGQPSGPPGQPVPSGVVVGHDASYPSHKNGNGTNSNGNHNGNGADGSSVPASPVYVGTL